MRTVQAFLVLAVVIGGATLASAHPNVVSISPTSVTSAGPVGGILTVAGSCFTEDCEDLTYTVTDLAVFFVFGGRTFVTTTTIDPTGTSGDEQLLITWPTIGGLDLIDGVLKVVIRRTSQNGQGTTRIFDSTPISLDVAFSNSVQPVNLPLRVAVKNAQNQPVTNARVIAERANVPIGVRMPIAKTDANGAIYELIEANQVSYTVTVHAPGFLASTQTNVAPANTETPDATFTLTSQSIFTAPGVVELELKLKSADINTGPTHVLTKTARLFAGGEALNITPIYGQGTVIFFGVPPGSYVARVPATTDYTFTDTPFTLGTGQVKVVSVDTDTTYVAPSPSRFSGIPGSIAGFVTATGGTPAVLPGAQVINIQANSDYATYTYAIAGGYYFIADVEAGLGLIQAFSADGSLHGPAKEADVVEGQVFGDDDPSPEDSDLTVPVDAADLDGNGLPDAFEVAYLDGNGLTEEEASAAGDPDRDGLTNLDEATGGTDPLLNDTDNDGFDDGMESILASDPNDIGDTPAIPDPVYVDFGYDNGPEAGSLGYPFSDLDTAAAFAAPGATIRIKGDVDVLAGPVLESAVSKLLTVEAFNGAISVGDGA